MYMTWDRFREGHICCTGRSLKPFKGLNGRFDASLTALTKRSPTVHVFFAFYVIVFDTGYGAKVYYLVYCVTKRFYFKNISYKYSIAQ